MQGFYNVIKPTGVSSAYIVGKIKKILKQKRVGHMGTLDPAAAGVLTIGVGKATRFFDYFLNKDKVYYAIAEFGVQTDTLDSEGEVLLKTPKNITKQEILDKLPNFIGKIEQFPPLYSAININGMRAYELARKGEQVEMPKREVLIYDFKLVDQIDENKYAFRVNCQAGTYIRSLLFDLAKSLNTVANIPVIIREKSGEFDIFNGVTLADIEKNPQSSIISVEEIMSNIKKIDFEEDVKKKILNGVGINNKYGLKDKEEILGYIDNKLFGLFTCDKGILTCKINLYEEET